MKTVLSFYSTPVRHRFSGWWGIGRLSLLFLLHENKLYSCSYDRTLRLWNLSADRMESVVVLEGSSWLRTLALVPDRKLLLAGDEGGTLYRLSVSPDSMAARIKRNLPRDFTPEEWAYYVGSRIPFEHYISKEHDL